MFYTKVFQRFEDQLPFQLLLFFRDYFVTINSDTIIPPLNWLISIYFNHKTTI